MFSSGIHACKYGCFLLLLPFWIKINELIALDMTNYHDENRSQTHSLVAPAYSTKDARKYLKFSLDIKICLFVCEFGYSKMRPSFFYEVTLQFFLKKIRI